MIVTNIPFQVNSQIIKFSTAAQLVANSAGIATATFSFSTDWLEYEIIKVIFSNGETKKSKILTTGQYVVTIPSECMTPGRLLVSAVGLSGETGEETFKRATTELNKGVEVIHSGAFEGAAADLPTPTEAEQILLIAQNANTTATQANTTANTANTNANAAVTTANSAESTAELADEKAQEALDKFPYVIMGETIYGGTIADNLNTIIKNGYYTCYGGATGAPGTTSSWFIDHHNSNAGTVTATQFAYSFTDETVAYKRNKIASVWQPWKRFPDTRYKGLRLARQIVLTDTAATIEFNTDSDGNALNSTLGGELLLYSGANASISTSAWVYAQFNNATSSVYWSTLSSLSTSIHIGSIGSQFAKNNLRINILGSNLVIDSSYLYRYSTAGSGSVAGGGMTTLQTSVTAIKLFPAAGTFPAGTVVEWWERG